MVTFYNKNKWVGVITLVLLIANIITLIMLWTDKRQPVGNMPSPPPHQPGGGPAFEFVVNELDMDEQQQKEYSLLREEHQQQVRPLADSIAVFKRAYFDLLKDSNITDARLLDQSSKTMQLQQQIELVHFRHFQKVRELCNKKQQQKFDNIIQEVLKRFGGQRSPLKDGPPPPP